MDRLKRMYQILIEQGGEVLPMYIMVVVVDANGAGLKFVAQDPILQAWINVSGRESLHHVVDLMCDGLKPPDDQPPGIKHTIILDGADV